MATYTASGQQKRGTSPYLHYIYQNVLARGILFVTRLVRRDLWRDEAVVESDWAGL